MLTLLVVAHPDDEILGFGATGAKLVEQGEIVQPVILSSGAEYRTQRPATPQLLADIERANGVVGFQAPVLGSFPNIQMNTIPHIDIVRFIEEQVAAFNPSRIVTHHPSDLNNDHLQVSRCCAAAARLYQRQPSGDRLRSFMYMEVPSATDWGFPGQSSPFVPERFVEVGGFIEKKLEALACYRSVMRPYPHPRSAEAIRALAQFRGAQSGLNMAEAFQTAYCIDL